ncbi:hypothetical protein ACWGQ5_24565 [Streptomyces sp. NPDC055722]
MYVEVKQSAQGEPQVEVREPDDCTRLHIVSSGLTGEQVLQLLAARGAALAHPEPGHVRIRVEWLRSSAQAASVGEDWTSRFEQMLRYSGDRGWLEPATQTLATHIVRG